MSWVAMVRTVRVRWFVRLGCVVRVAARVLWLGFGSVWVRVGSSMVSVGEGEGSTARLLCRCVGERVRECGLEI